MGNFVGSFILLQNSVDQKTHWLAHWNYERQEFMLPGDKKRPYETFQHCLISELEKTFERAGNRSRVHHGRLPDLGPVSFTLL